MSRELWEKVTDGIEEKYINEASECFQKHNRLLITGDEEIGEQAIPIEIKPSAKKRGGWKAALAVVGAAAAVVLCVIGGQYLLNGSTPIDPITSNSDGTEETSETIESTESDSDTVEPIYTPVNGLEQNIALLPPYNMENYVFDTNNIPFAASIGLPEGWSIEDTRILADGEEIAGITYDYYEIYPEAVGQDNYYRAVYNQIMLGSVVTYDIDYTPVQNGAYYSNATAKRAVRDPETGEITYDQAILAYNDRIRSYIVITFNQDIDPQLLSDIAYSIELVWDRFGTSKLLASAFAGMWARIYDENGMMKPEIHAIIADIDSSHKLMAVMFPAAGSYGALIFELDGSMLNYLGEIYNADTLEIYANDGFMLHTISEYGYGAAAGNIIEYVDTYYTIANNTIEQTDHARRIEENGIITSIYDSGQSEMSYEEYVAWKIGQTADYYYIRSAQFPENEDKLVPISEDQEVMEEYFLSVLEDSPPNGGTYDDADGIVQEEKDLTTLYAMIAERILGRDFVPEQAGIFSSPMDSAQMVGIYYERDGRQCCQLYYIRDNEMYFIGELTDLITLELIGDDLITSSYTSVQEARYITDSYVKFQKFGDIYTGEEYDRAERLLDENGNVTMYFDDQVTITETAYRNKRNRLREAAGDTLHYGIDLSLPYETITIEKDIAALAEQIRLADADEDNIIAEEEAVDEYENVSDGMIYVNTLPIDESVIEYANDMFEREELEIFGFTAEQADSARLGEGYQVRSMSNYYAFSDRYYFPIVYNNEILSHAMVSEFNGELSWQIYWGGEWEDNLNQLKTSPSDPADFVSSENALYAVTDNEATILTYYLYHNEGKIPYEMEELLADRKSGALDSDTVTVAINKPYAGKPYKVIAEDFVKNRSSDSRFSIFSWRPESYEEYVVIYYPDGDRGICHLYYIHGTNVSLIGKYETLTEFELMASGLHMKRRYYENTVDLELITDSYAELKGDNGGKAALPVGITIKSLNADGSIEGTYTTKGVDIHSTFDKADYSSYLREQDRLSGLLGRAMISVDFTDNVEYTYSADNADDVASYLAAERQMVADSDIPWAPGDPYELKYVENGVYYYLDNSMRSLAAIDDNGNILWCNDNGTYLKYAEALSELTLIGDLEGPMVPEDDNSDPEPDLYKTPDGLLIGIAKCSRTIESQPIWNSLKLLFDKSQMYSITYYFTKEQINTVIQEPSSPVLPSLKYNNEVYYTDLSVGYDLCVIDDSGKVHKGLEHEVFGGAITDLNSLTYVGALEFFKEDSYEVITADIYKLKDDRLLAIYPIHDGILNSYLSVINSGYVAEEYPEDWCYEYVVCCRTNEEWNGGTNLPEPPQLTITADGVVYPMATGSYTWESLKYGTMHSDGDIDTALSVPYSKNELQINIPDGGIVTKVIIPPPNPGQTYSYDLAKGTIDLNSICDVTCTITVEYAQGVCEYYFYIDSTYNTNS